MPLTALLAALLSAAAVYAEPQPVRRMLDELPDFGRPLERDVLSVPLDEQWTASSGQAPECRSGALVVHPGVEPVLISRTVAFELGRYTALRLRLAAAQGEYAQVYFTGPLEPEPTHNPGLRIPIIADGAAHTCEVPLHDAEGMPLFGAVTRVTVQPSNTAGPVTLEAFTLLAAPGAAPARITLLNQTRPACFAGPHAWLVVPQQDATLDFAFGLADRAWRELRSDGVMFRLAIDNAAGRRIILFERHLDPLANAADRGWQTAQVPLAEYAGKAVRLVFETMPGADAAGDYALWGAPAIFRAPAPETTPVVLISIDTLRTDHLEIYGYDRPNSSHIAAFARDAVLFENAFTPEVWTPSAHMSMLTGLYPKHHGVTANINLPESVVTLAEVLAHAGYLTASHVGMKWWFTPWRGFAQGFDVHQTPEAVGDVFNIHRDALAWLDAHRLSNVFLFVHNYDLHSTLATTLPYDPRDDRFRRFTPALGAQPEFTRPGKVLSGTLFLAAHNNGDIEISPHEREYMLGLYDECILKVDQAVGELLDALKQRGLYDNALIILTADHGEAFGEHNRYMHGDVYEHNMRVPLLIKFPGARFAGQRRPEFAQLTDIYPTVLDVLGLAPAPECDGQSLLALLDGRTPPITTVFSQRGAWETVRTTHAKLIRNRDTNTLSLYDIGADPREERDRIAEVPPQFEELKAALDGFFQPPAYGWHLAFRGGPWSAEVRIDAGARILSAGLEFGLLLERNDQVSQGNSLEAQIRLTRAVPEDTLVIRTARPGSELAVRITAETPFTLDLDGDPAAPVPEHSFVLTPALARPAPALAPSGAPGVVVWFVPPPVTADTGPGLSPDAIQQLKALGYLAE